MVQNISLREKSRLQPEKMLRFARSGFWSQITSALDLSLHIQYNTKQGDVMTFDELETVALMHDIKQYGLKEGDLGTVVHTYHDEEAFEIEFVTAAGKTLALLTLTATDIRSLAQKEILHVREFATI